MPKIHLTTFIAAPIDIVFDLSRHIGLHKKTMSKYKEEAVAGVQLGLIEEGETVTWRARHLWKTRFLQTKIREMRKPHFFIDEQVMGDFKRLYHEHHFKAIDNGTIMIDIFEFESPYAALGRLFNRIYLTRYLHAMLTHRNTIIKEMAESGKWKPLLS